MRALAFLCTTALWLPVSEATGRADSPAVQEDSEDELQRLSAWPELTKDAAKTVKTDVARLRKARTEAMGEEARTALLGVGAGAAPALLIALGKEKNEDARERIVAVLDGITGAAHTRLLSAEFAHRSDVVRTWSMERVAAFPDPGVRAAAEKAWGKLAKLREKDKAAPGELLACALALASSGSTESLDHLFDYGKKKWRKRGAQIRTAVEACRSKAASDRITPFLESSERIEKVCALRLLAGCGEGEEVVRLVRPSLDSEDNEIRIAAINALRGIIDGDPPLAKLSAFQAIETAKKWKSRT